MGLKSNATNPKKTCWNVKEKISIHQIIIFHQPRIFLKSPGVCPSKNQPRSCFRSLSFDQKQYGCFQQYGAPPKWMVCNGKPLLKWMIWEETPLFLERPIYNHLAQSTLKKRLEVASFGSIDSQIVKKPYSWTITEKSSIYIFFQGCRIAMILPNSKCIQIWFGGFLEVQKDLGKT